MNCCRSQNAIEGLRIFRLMKEKGVKADFIVCATMIMLCSRAMLFDEALAVCGEIASCNLALTYQQHSYICSHIVGCFVKLEPVKDRKIELATIFQLLSSLLDSDAEDFTRDTLSDATVYQDLLQGLRSLDKVVKSFPDSQQAVLLQRCMSSVESRIPPGRTRTSSSPSVQSHLSSNLSSGAASPIPSLCVGPVSARDLSIMELRLIDKESDQRQLSEVSNAQIPHADDKPLVLSPERSIVASCLYPSYVFIPSDPLLPDSFRFLTREIDEICEEFQMTDAERSVRLELIKEIDHMVGKWNPAFKVALFGSFSTGLCDKNCDLDLLIATPVALAYMQSHNFYETTCLPSPPLPPVMLDDLFILIQTDPSLAKRHERSPRQVDFDLNLPSELIHLQLYCGQRACHQASS